MPGVLYDRISLYSRNLKTTFEIGPPQKDQLMIDETVQATAIFSQN